MTALSMLPLPTRLGEVVSYRHGHGFAGSAYLVSTYAGRGVSYRHQQSSPLLTLPGHGYGRLMCVLWKRVVMRILQKSGEEDAGTFD